MSRWIDAIAEEYQVTASLVAKQKLISESAVEKDWWVTAILKALFSLSPAKYMLFKGGTSLSKGWNLIDRFSEDIDIAIYRDFYLFEQRKECAKAENNNQVKKLRIANRDYILGDFTQELKYKLREVGLGECLVVPVKEREDGTPIDHDSDPVVIEIHYPVKIKSDAYVRPIVKIEISCLSMREPYEVKRISSLIGDMFPEIENETFADIPTITPARTFLEKAFLLNEEYQRSNPRTDRMSRHLYDLERMMDSKFVDEALSDLKLYEEVISHRERFYHVGGVNYALNRPACIAFCPTGEIRNRMKVDYDAMKGSMIYGEKLDFDSLMNRLESLQRRFNTLGNLSQM